MSLLVEKPSFVRPRKKKPLSASTLSLKPVCRKRNSFDDWMYA